MSPLLANQCATTYLHSTKLNPAAVLVNSLTFFVVEAVIVKRPFKRVGYTGIRVSNASHSTPVDR